jgi:hypothetical protein
MLLFPQYLPTPDTQASSLGFFRPSVADALLGDHHWQLGVSGTSCRSLEIIRRVHCQKAKSGLFLFRYISNQVLRTDVTTGLVEKSRRMYRDVSRYT